MSAAARLQKNVSTTRTALVSYVLLARWAGSGDGFFIGACSAAVGGSTLTPCIPATVLAGTLGPLGRSSDEHLCEKNYPVKIARAGGEGAYGGQRRLALERLDRGGGAARRHRLGGVLRRRDGRDRTDGLGEALFRRLECVHCKRRPLMTFFVRCNEMGCDDTEM
jgi:hypothetical protein